MLEFPKTDEAFVNWLVDHPHGFVINAHKTGAFPMYWHRADCGHLGDDATMRWVTGEFIKACSIDPAPLAVWAKSRSEDLKYCATCRDRWLKEHGVTA